VLDPALEILICGLASNICRSVICQGGAPVSVSEVNSSCSAGTPKDRGGRVGVHAAFVTLPEFM